MASIPANVILIWTGTNASIPTGWTRETSLDSKFVKGWGDVSPNNTGGAATHTHTSPAHSHTLNSHTHTYTLSNAGAGGTGMQSGASNSGIVDYHTHSGTSGTSSGGTTSSTSVTYGAVSNDPPNRAVIFIKAGVGALLVENIVGLWNSNTPPSNWTNVSELADRYLKGALTGADADLTTNSGSYTNIHNIDHSHTSNPHTHVAANSDVSYDQKGGGGNDNKPDAWHVHSVTLNAATSVIPNYSGSLTTTETVEPAYAKLQAIRKGASGLKPIGLIGLWLGAVGDIPKGWVLCDGSNGTKDLRNKYIKIGNPSDPNGGSNTHTHSAQSHTHNNPSSHTHTGSSSAHVQGGGWTDANPQHCVNIGAVHPVTNIQSVVATYASANTTADSSSNEPEYRTVAYIQFQKEIRGGGMMLPML